MKEKSINEEHSFENEVNLFIDHIDSLYQTLPTVNIILKVTQFTTEKKIQDYIKEKGIVGSNENDNIDFSYINKYLDLDKKAKNSILAQKIIQRNFIVSLVSQFDAYIGSLIRKIFIVKPELLNGSEKNLSFNKLSEYDSIEAVKEYIIEKEIESVLRDSHASQFKWIENKLGIPLTKELPSWCEFIEITERRNLFVHSNGVISSQYISVCNNYNVTLNDKSMIGSTLEVDDEYFFRAYKCLYEIGVKLSQVIWRKLLPNNIENADMALNHIIYFLLKREEYQLAINLSDFATSTLKKHSSQEFKVMFNVNKAQAYKWDGQEEICIKMMNSIDWSAMSDKFKLSKGVLINDFEYVYKLMKKIGLDEDELPKSGYKEWPLFNKIREEQKFKDTFKEIFNEEYEYVKYDNDLPFKKDL